MMTLAVPLPPSTNALTRNKAGGGRVKTAAYRTWLDEAGHAATSEWRRLNRPTFAKPLALTIRLGLRTRNRDASNCLKPIEDMLVKSIDGLPDDRWNDRILIERDESVPAGTAIVSIESLAPG